MSQKKEKDMPLVTLKCIAQERKIVKILTEDILAGTYHTLTSGDLNVCYWPKVPTLLTWSNNLPMESE